MIGLRLGGGGMGKWVFRSSTLGGCFGSGDALRLRGSIPVVGLRLGGGGMGKWVSRSFSVVEGNRSGVAAGLSHRWWRDGPPGRNDLGRVFRLRGCAAVERFDSRDRLAVGWGRDGKVGVPVFLIERCRTLDTARRRIRQRLGPGRRFRGGSDRIGGADRTAVVEGNRSGVAAGLSHRWWRDGPPGRNDLGRVFRLRGCAAVERFDFRDRLAVGWGRDGKVGVPVFYAA